MKIKYKLIIILIIIIVIASLPLSFYIIRAETREKISSLAEQGIINSQILSRSALNIILMNGGNIKPSRVDSAEMISILRPLTNTGLIYADAILFSKNPEYNGLILASIARSNGGSVNPVFPDRITPADAKRIGNNKPFTEFYSDNFKEEVYEIFTNSVPIGDSTYCTGRLIFSKSVILKSVTRLRNLVAAATTGSIVIAIIIGLILARTISNPLERLIKGVEIIGGGDFDYRINFKGKGEIRKLSNTFNHLAQILKLEINHLITKNLELERINNLKDNFLANVTHELRTPLYGMIGIAESLLAGVAGDMDENARYNLSLMINSGRRLSSLVNDILDYSQLKHEDITLHFSSIDLYSITRLIISITAPLVKNKDLNIKVSIDPGIFIVLADENRIQQIMINIVGNAIKFTETGEIEISAKFSEKNPEDIIVSVRDTGIGIRKEDQDRIFELFEQAEGSISKYKTGTGVGLSITKQLIELHGGTIWVESEPQKGSCFYFTLKKSDQKQIFLKEKPDSFSENISNDIVPVFGERIMPASVNPDNALAYSTIMIVDDEPVNSQILINYLFLEGYVLIPVSNGPEALDKMQKGQVPDLLILDVMLPLMSGYDVCKKVREKYSPGELPILILTAKSSPSDLLIGFDAGTNDFLTKPVSKAELLARVNGLLQLKKSVKDQNQLNLIKQEITIARRIQTNLLENKFPNIDDISLALRYYPMYEIGGDFYEISPIDDDRIGIFIADVSGHGIPAAFISAMLKVICNFYSKIAQNPKEFMEKINQVIYDLIEDQFITACYSIIDIKTGKLIQSNAGHWPMILYRKNTNELIFRKQSRMPFGCVPDETYENLEYDLDINDRLIFYTDGIIEIKNKDNEMFGINNFKDLISETADFELNEFADNIIGTIQKWYDTKDTVFTDDVTLLVFDVNKLGNAAKSLN